MNAANAELARRSNDLRRMKEISGSVSRSLKADASDAAARADAMCVEVTGLEMRTESLESALKAADAALAAANREKCAAKRREKFALFGLAIAAVRALLSALAKARK